MRPQACCNIIVLENIADSCPIVRGVLIGCVYMKHDSSDYVTELHQFVWLNLGIKQSKITHYVQIRYGLVLDCRSFQCVSSGSAAVRSSRHNMVTTKVEPRSKVKREIHKRHSIAHSHRWAMGCMLWVLWKKLIGCVMARFDYRWLSARLQYLQCWCMGDTTVLHFAGFDCIDGLAQDWSFSIADVLKMQSCTKPSFIELSCLFCMDTFPTST